MATPTKPSGEDCSVQTVLNVFDTLFNKRDYASAERFWSPHYIQHSCVPKT
jgi:predicted SnoaL-like aldol condensation-catalyzing enzyme